MFSPEVSNDKRNKQQNKYGDLILRKSTNQYIELHAVFYIYGHTRMSGNLSQKLNEKKVVFILTFWGIVV